MLVCVRNFLYWQFFNGYMLNYSVVTKAYISFSIEWKSYDFLLTMHKHLINVISKQYPINLYTHYIFVKLCLTLTQRDSGIYLWKKKSFQKVLTHLNGICMKEKLTKKECLKLYIFHSCVIHGEIYTRF